MTRRMQGILAAVRMQHLYSTLLESTDKTVDRLLVARDGFGAEDDGISLIQT